MGAPHEVIYDTGDNVMKCICVSLLILLLFVLSFQVGLLRL